MKKLTAFLPLLLFLLLALGLGFAFSKGKNPDQFIAHVGEVAPHYAIGSYDPDQWRGRMHLVNFFASWCVPCHAEHPLLKSLARDVPVIGIAYRDQPAATENFLDDLGNPFALVAHDPEGRGGIEWGITGVPETFLIDAEGTIRLHHRGPLTTAIVEAQIIPLLSPS